MHTHLVMTKAPKPITDTLTKRKEKNSNITLKTAIKSQGKRTQEEERPEINYKSISGKLPNIWKLKIAFK